MTTIPIRIIILTAVLIVTIINLILTIHEIFMWYHDHPMRGECGANAGRIKRGGGEPDGCLCIDCDSEVCWIIKEGKFIDDLK